MEIENGRDGEQSEREENGFSRFLLLFILLNLNLFPFHLFFPFHHHQQSSTDDSLAIIAAFACPELEIIGLTTTFGNVHTPTATKNAFVLLDLLGVRVPVAQGALGPVDGGGRPHLKVASFVHGEDGLGNTEEERRKKKKGGGGGEEEEEEGDGDRNNNDDSSSPPSSRFSADPRSAAEFIADSVRAFPGEVSVLALGPSTNVAEALLLLGKREREKEQTEEKKASTSSSPDPAIPPPLSRQQSQGGHQIRDPHPACSSAAASLFAEVVALGGAFFRNGNVTPAAEANVLADPAAADLVLSTPGLRVRMVGLDVTHSCRMTAGELESLRGKFFFFTTKALHKKSRNRKKTHFLLSLSFFSLPLEIIRKRQPRRGLRRGHLPLLPRVPRGGLRDAGLDVPARPDGARGRRRAAPVHMARGPRGGLRGQGGREQEQQQQWWW